MAASRRLAVDRPLVSMVGGDTVCFMASGSGPALIEPVRHGTIGFRPVFLPLAMCLLGERRIAAAKFAFR